MAMSLVPWSIFGSRFQAAVQSQSSAASSSTAIAAILAHALEILPICLAELPRVDRPLAWTLPSAFRAAEAGGGDPADYWPPTR